VNSCKACSSPQRSYIDDALNRKVPYRVIVEELAARGERFSQNNLSSHKRKHWSPPDAGLDAAVETIRAQIEHEMAQAATPAIAAGWLIVLHQLDGLKGSKQDPVTFIKALSMMTRMGAITAEQSGLVAYMERAWPRQELRAVPDKPEVG
jgi:hypothetical protein